MILRHEHWAMANLLIGRYGPRRAAAQALFAHAGHATDRALDVVYGLLELTPVSQVREVREVRGIPPTQTEKAS